MYKKIETLDNLTINKIAAGEVVEAPYSVVKELVENSIDAAASVITLEIKDGGKKYIRVTDNGIGIGEKYVEKAFLRHSTSKITNISDLDSINSLGFRGEALASIAAVCQIEIVTRTEDQQYGILMKLSGGNIDTIKKVGCPVGTTIIVRNLFFNTPARLKFMKSNSIETMKISEIATRLTISNPSISFKYVNNNNIMFTSPGNKKLSDTILSVFDKNTFKNLIYLENRYLNMGIRGYIGQPSLVRGNRGMQIIYINGRYIKDRAISKAIEEAYKEKVIINKYPVCILNLYIEPSELDVNVHPAKTEVKFGNEQEVHEFVFKSIDHALKMATTIPKLIIEGQGDKKDQDLFSKPSIQIEDNIEENINEETFVNEANVNYIKDSNMGNTGRFIDIVYDENNNDKKLHPNNNMIETSVQSDFLNILLDGYKIIGQIFNTYIVLEKGCSIYLIDQHAAHERLLYNKFLEEIKNEKLVCQGLIEPKILELSNEDYLLLFDNINLFTELGFYIEDFGTNTAIIREVPMILGNPQNFSFVYEILDEIRNNNNIDNYFQGTIIKKACREAVKAKDKLDYYEIKGLVEGLYMLTPPLTCPHGRPIILTMSQYDIEKYFRRV